MKRQILGQIGIKLTLILLLLSFITQLSSCGTHYPVSTSIEYEKDSTYYRRISEHYQRQYKREQLKNQRYVDSLEVQEQKMVISTMERRDMEARFENLQHAHKALESNSMAKSNTDSNKKIELEKILAELSSERKEQDEEIRQLQEKINQQKELLDSRNKVKGTIGCAIPEKMKVGEFYEARAIIEKVKNYKQDIVRKHLKEFVDDIKNSNQHNPQHKIIIDEIDIYDSMTLRLVDPEKVNFDINDEMAPENQPTMKEQGIWTWIIKPLKSGRHKLVIMGLAKISTPTGMTERPFEVYKKEIEVEASTLYSAKQFVTSHWKWVFATLIIPAFAYGKRFYDKWRTGKDDNSSPPGFHQT